jgi:hypothetical protein
MLETALWSCAFTPLFISMKRLSSAWKRPASEEPAETSAWREGTDEGLEATS